MNPMTREWVEKAESGPLTACFSDGCEKPVETRVMTHHGISVRQNQLAEFCRRNQVCKLALFGSILRDDFRPDSDIDVLVEFEPGQVPGMLRMAALEMELAALFGRQVDLRTLAELSRHFRSEVLKEAEVQYVAA